MSNISLYVPKLEDYWFEQQVLSDEETMNYNAGYDVSYYGYNYETGCIDYPENRWKEQYQKRNKENKYFAYIKVDNEFIGTVNYHYVESEKRYECGIVIYSKYRGKGYSEIGLKLLCEKAKSEGIKELYDNFELERESAIKAFQKVGFKIVEKTTWKKFNKEVAGVVVKITL